MVHYLRTKFLSKKKKKKNCQCQISSRCYYRKYCKFTKPVLRENLDAVIMHAGSNNSTNNTNTMKKAREIAKTVQ